MEMVEIMVGVGPASRVEETEKQDHDGAALKQGRAGFCWFSVFHCKSPLKRRFNRHGIFTELLWKKITINNEKKSGHEFHEFARIEKKNLMSLREGGFPSRSAQMLLFDLSVFIHVHPRPTMSFAVGFFCFSSFIPLSHHLPSVDRYPLSTGPAGR